VANIRNLGCDFLRSDPA